MQSHSEWHRWFAWHPVVIAIEGRSEYWVWLEIVERKWGRSRYSGKGKWRYRPAGSSNASHRPS